MEIRFGGSRAAVAATGATLRAFEVDGVPYLETFADGEPAPMGSGAILFPWPNRTADAAWTYRGEVQRLDVTEPARGNASHGLVRKEEWSLVAHEDAAVTFEITVDGRAGWPFRFRAAVTYALSGDGLEITHAVENLGEHPMPFGVGTHPYPRAGLSDADDCVLTLAATTRLPLDPERMLPAGAPVPTSDFASGKPLRGVDLDDAFGGCLPDGDGLVRHTLRGPLGGVEVWAEPVFGWVQVFTPAEFPGRPGRAVAIEPMTCPPDALNSGTDLLIVAPGESWSASWGLRPLDTL